MIIDDQNIMSDQQAITDTTESTDVINFGDAKDHAKGNPLMLEVIVDETFISGGSSTLDVALETDTTTTITPDKSFPLRNAIAKSLLVQGYVIYRGSVPEGLMQYASMKYTANVADFTAGKITARFVEAFQSNVNG